MVSAFLRKLRRDTEEQTRVVYPWELPSIMRKHILTGAMGTVYFALLSGMFLVAFGHRVGLKAWHWGFLSSGASLTLALQIVSAHLVAKTGNRRTLWFTAALAGRMLRGLAVALAFWLSRGTPLAARVTFIGLLILATALEGVAAPPWFSWLADIIPREQHGRFMGRRQAWISLANVGVVVPCGFLLDRVGEASRTPVLLAVFAFAAAVGIFDLLIHRTIPEPPMDLGEHNHFWQSVLEPLRDERFRPWLAFNALWTFSMTLGGALAMVYFVDNLGISRNFFGGSVVLIVLPLLATMLAGRRLGLLVDRHGVKRVLWWAHRVWALLPLFWILATPSTAMLWLGAAALLGGLAGTAAFTAAGKLTTRLPQREHVAMYVAVSTCVGSVAGALGPALAGGVLYLLRDFSWQVAGITIVGFHVIFAASLLLRNLSTLMIPRICEPAPGDKVGVGAGRAEAARARSGASR
ncbi:MAG: MFS transporter [Planctomycetota bacterium]